MGSKFMTGQWIAHLICLALFAFCIPASQGSAQEPINHKVEKGDTLWSISERYYGRSDLWPSLWEMNPFVTNPHLLKPGDMIRVGTQETAAPTAPEAPAPEVKRIVEIPKPKDSGINVGSITKVNARGLLAKNVQPWSFVQASDSGRLLLSKRDLLFLNFSGRPGVKLGDEFMIFRPMSPVKHVITGDNLGTLYSARAKVVLKEHSIRDIYRAEMQENYTDVNVGDLVFPFIPIPSCLTPLASDPDLRGMVVAVQNMQLNFGRNVVVYLDCGRDKGLFPGSMLELVRFINIPDPAVGTDLKSLFFGLFKVKTLAELYQKATREAMANEKTVGRMIVLDVGPNTATALVLSTNENLQVGTFFKGTRSWQNSAGHLPAFPACPSQP